jgi:hypothetical protein
MTTQRVKSEEAARALQNMSQDIAGRNCDFLGSTIKSQVKEKSEGSGDNKTTYQVVEVTLSVTVQYEG